MAERRDHPGPKRTDDNPVIDKFNMLVRFATDPSTRQTEEGENAGRALAMLIKNNGLVVGGGTATPNASKQADERQDAFTKGINESLLRQLLDVQQQLRNSVSYCAKLQEEVSQWRAYAAAQEAREQELQRQSQQHNQWHTEYWAKQEAELVARVSIELLELFKTEPVQRGTAQIAKKLGCQQARVRKAIAKLVADGTLIASGSTRNRTYSRPTQNGRESFASNVVGTQKASKHSRPAQERRESVN